MSSRRTICDFGFCTEACLLYRLKSPALSSKMRCMSKLWCCVLMVFALFASPVLANMVPACTDTACHEDLQSSKQKQSQTDHTKAVHHCCCHISAADRKLEYPYTVATASGEVTIVSLNSNQVGLYQPGPLLKPPSHA